MQKMKAIVMRGGRVHLESIDRPVPAEGQVLVKSLACGICGSDLHIAKHQDEVFELYKNIGVMSADQNNHTGIMLGHEFSAEVVAYGPDTQALLAVGTRVTSVPILLSKKGAGVGVTPEIHGAYSEYFLVDEALLLAIPDNLPSEAAAITEPLAVGLHAVNRSQITVGETALVVGCGPIGLAVIGALKQKGIKHIVASDPLLSKREAAKQFGATSVVNPLCDDEINCAENFAAGKRLVIFECVGIHSLIKHYIARAPQQACLVITGIHTAETTVNYAYASVKELDIKFSYYYTPEEFSECLTLLADGLIDWKMMCTAKVGIDGVVAAFDELLIPNEHIKVLIEPWRTGGLEAFSA